MLTTRELVAMFPEGVGLLHVVDVGAMSLGEGKEPYYPLVKDGLARVTGFEPVADECAKLNARFGPPHRFFPYAIGDGSARTLHVGRSPMTSSLYEPNMELLSLFHQLGELHEVVRTEPVQTVRLDDIEACREAEYLKIDVQGAELDVLRGAERTLGSVLMLQVEVEFVEMYKGQPLFADVDAYVRGRGFMFHRLPGVGGRAFKPFVVANDQYAPISQHLWTDVTYVRSFMQLDRIENPTALLKLVVLLHNQGSIDLARLVLAEHDRRRGGRLADSYMRGAARPAAGG